MKNTVYFVLPPDLNLKILKDDSACPGACQVIQWYVCHSVVIDYMYF